MSLGAGLDPAARHAGHQPRYLQAHPVRVGFLHRAHRRPNFLQPCAVWPYPSAACQTAEATGPAQHLLELEALKALLGIEGGRIDLARVCLGRGTGRSIALAVGGARECLFVEPGLMNIILERRLGFVRIALETGAPQQGPRKPAHLSC